jgi:hypothetical protein
MSTGARAYLGDVAEYLDEGFGAIRRLLASARNGDDAAILQLNEIYGEAENGRLTGPFAQARGRIGRAFGSTLARVVMEIGSGDFAGFAVDEVDRTSAHEASVIARAFAVSRARSDSIPGVEPWFSGDLEADLIDVAQKMTEIDFSAIAARADEALDAARKELLALLTTLSGAADMADRLFGRGKFGFRALANAISPQDYQSQAFLLLTWTNMREDSQLAEKMAEWSENAEALEELQTAMATLEALADAIPAYRELLTPAKLGAALTNPEAREEYEAELLAVREAHADEVTRVLSDLAAADTG